MAESKLRTLSIDFAVQMLNLFMIFCRFLSQTVDEPILSSKCVSEWQERQKGSQKRTFSFFIRDLHKHNSSKNNPAADKIHRGIVFILQ